MTREIHDTNTRALDFVVELIEYIFEYPDDDYMTMECLCRKLVKHGLLDKADGYYQTHDIHTNTHECVKDTHDKTENNSEKPNNCETCRFELYCPEMCEGCCEWDSHYEPKDEPQTSGVVWTEDAIKDEPKSYSTWASTDEPQKLDCRNKKYYSSCKYANKCHPTVCFKALDEFKEKLKDEPQTDEHCETCRHKDECEGATYEYKNTEWWCLAYAPIEDEPQTDCAWK